MQGHSLANGTEKQTDGNAINWRKANRSARNLRHRIFRAAHEGSLNKVRSLQKLMLKSYSNRLVSVRRVAQINAGKNTPGVDKLVLKTPAARGRMVDTLAHASPWKAKPVRRVYIPKANNKLRPLGIPVVMDRCRRGNGQECPRTFLGSQVRGNKLWMRDRDAVDMTPSRKSSD
jgi:RNA-directed DNA polymerase